jgi:hypothetical protein
MTAARKSKGTTRSTRPPGPRASTELPTDAREALARDATALVAWEALAPSHRREHVAAIVGAKKPETRARRITRMLERLHSPRASLSNPPSTRPMLAKMGITPGQRILVLDADAQALASWTDLPAGCRLDTRGGRGGYDVVVLYVPTAADLARRLPTALRAVGSAGILWVAYLKQASGRATTLTRDVGWEPTHRPELKPMAMIALDDHWAGVKHRLLPVGPPR